MSAGLQCPMPREERELSGVFGLSAGPPDEHSGVLTVLPPAFSELTLKEALILPGFLNLSSTLTVFEAPAGIVPTVFLPLTPLPLTWSFTPAASVLPELEALTL